MAESKIEKSEPGIDFESLYNQAVKLIDANNPAFAPIPSTVKNQFLNLYHLPPNEQLELISDLSGIENLPQVMKELINQFPYFDKIPNDIISVIASYLQKIKPKEDKDISALVTTHKRPHALFQPNRLGNLLSLLLMAVPRGKQNEAERIVDMHPELQLEPGTLTDYAGRIFMNITAYEYAYWAKDTHMCCMLEKHMSSEIKAEMLKRCENIEKNGLTYIQQGVKVTGSKHFDFTPLKTALQNYIDGYSHWCKRNNWTAMRAAWMQVGLAQHNLPVHVLNEYCRKDRSFDPKPTFKEDSLPRELTFYSLTTETEQSLLPFIVAGRLGVDLALTRMNCGTAQGASVRVWIPKLDLEAINQLDKVRTNDLALLRNQLRLEKPLQRVILR
jgi:hypothetical protein